MYCLVPTGPAHFYPVTILASSIGNSLSLGDGVLHPDMLSYSVLMCPNFWSPDFWLDPVLVGVTGPSVLYNDFIRSLTGNAWWWTRNGIHLLLICDAFKGAPRASIHQVLIGDVPVPDTLALTFGSERLVWLVGFPGVLLWMFHRKSLHNPRPAMRGGGREMQLVFYRFATHRRGFPEPVYIRFRLVTFLFQIPWP